MGFLRTKTIKGNEYLYYVENKYKSGKIVQKSKKYLGRVLEFEKEKDLEVDSEIFTTLSFDASIMKLIGTELLNRGFDQKKEIFEKGNITVNLRKKKVWNKNREIAIKMNQGYLCNYNLKKLLNFKVEEDWNYKDIGLNLANILANNGIKPKPEEFITIVQSMLN